MIKQFAKYGLILMVACVLAVIALVAWGLARDAADRVKETVGGPFALGACYLGSAEQSTSSPLAFTYLTKGAASTTMDCYVGRGDIVDFNIQAVGSTTAADLTWENSFCDENKDCFGEDGKTVNSNTSTTHSATTTVHNWVLTTATTSKNVTIDPLAAYWVRIKFGVRAANAAIWIKGVPRQPDR